MLHCDLMKTRQYSSLCTRLFALILGLAPGLAAAASIEFRVTDASGVPLQDVAVYATPRQPLPPRPRHEAIIAQVKRQFAPLVSVIQTGTAVNFPNRDDVRHHVYSFSPAKTFEIKLYVGTPAKPVLFDKPGEVVLGCNIHDQMRGFVFVVDTPFVAKTDAAGRAVVDDLPAGEFDVGVWHYAQSAVQPVRRLRVSGDQPLPAAFTLQLRPGQIPAR
jgi:plastocyanin